MVGWMTYGYKKFESVDTIMRQAIPPLNDATQRLLPLIDMDSEAYTSYTEATKLPKKTEEEKTKYNMHRISEHLIRVFCKQCVTNSSNLSFLIQEESGNGCWVEEGCRCSNVHHQNSQSVLATSCQSC